jgi:hypothetical protein
VREIVEREAFGISPWRPSNTQASVWCNRRPSGQRRLCPSEKGLRDVAHLRGSVITLGVMRCVGPRSADSVLGRWRNGSKRPVLKHGPRSLTSMRVFGCKARPRNESECRRELFWVHRRPVRGFTEGSE